MSPQDHRAGSPLDRKAGSPQDRQAGSKLRVTWVKSAIGSDQRQRSTLKGLGLRRLNHTVEVPDDPAVRGMISKVLHLVRVED